MTTFCWSNFAISKLSSYKFMQEKKDFSKKFKLVSRDKADEDLKQISRDFPRKKSGWILHTNHWCLFCVVFRSEFCFVVFLTNTNRSWCYWIKHLSNNSPLRASQFSSAWLDCSWKGWESCQKKKTEINSTRCRLEKAPKGIFMGKFYSKWN